MKAGKDEESDTALDEGNGRSGSVQAVAVSFDIVEALAHAGDSMGVSELSRQLGHTKARVHRHLVTLRELGFVEQDSTTDRYRLGWKIYRLGMSVAEGFGIRRLAHRHLIRLRHETGQTVVLAAPAETRITIVDTVQSRGDIAISVRPGSTIAATTTALGRAILAFQPEPVIDAILDAQTDSGPSANQPSRKEVMKVLATVRRQWYAIAVNARLPGVTSLAAPVFDHSDCVAGSVSILAPNSVFTPESLPGLAGNVQRAARDISTELRSSAWDRAGTRERSSTAL